jgi:hypothetical protein
MNKRLKKYGWILLALSPNTHALEFEDLAYGGQLKFFSERPDPGAYWFESKAVLSAESFKSGLVDIYTCHNALDPNRKIEINFNPERVQNLQISHAVGMEQALVAGHRVVLLNVQRGASACISIKSKALERTSSGNWKLHAGPLMRLYLDGYLPMQAKLHIAWPEGLLKLVATSPTPQPGVKLSQTSNTATLDMTFAGSLRANWEVQPQPIHAPPNASLDQPVIMTEPDMTRTRR